MSARSHFGQSDVVKSILRLQRSMGNRAVLRLQQNDAQERDVPWTGDLSAGGGNDLSRVPSCLPPAGRPSIPLTVNKPGDPYEHEADRVAEYVMRMPGPGMEPAGAYGGGRPGSRAKPLSRGTGTVPENRVGPGDRKFIAAPPIVQEVLATPGQPLDAATRAFMEPRFGRCFAEVRIHADEEAAESAHAVGARAYTVGSHIVLGKGASMGSPAGLQLLAHELAHTVQQGIRTVPGEPVPKSSQNSGVEGQARAVERGARTVPTLSDARGPCVQRDVLGSVGEALTQPFENIRHPIDLTALPLAGIFDGVVNSNITVASAISVPAHWSSIVLEYSAAHPRDGAVLIPALARGPSFWRGGWIMSLQPGAAAMTLDDDVFVSGDLSLSTFVHELVHVWQYTLFGKFAFLESYFGLSAATIAYRWATGQPLDVMRSSPHEEQAYNLETRFDSWYATTKGGSAGSVTA